MAALHTPGPWYPGHISDDASSCNCRSIVDEGYAGGIATVHVNNGINDIAAGGNDCPSLEEAKANSRLISAVPELAEAVQRLLMAISKDMYVEDFDKEVAFAKSALAKAGLA